MLINDYRLRCFMSNCGWAWGGGTHYVGTCGSQFSSTNMGPRDQTQMARLGSKCLYLTSHLKKLILSQIAVHAQELMAIVSDTFPFKIEILISVLNVSLKNQT